MKRKSALIACCTLLQILPGVAMAETLQQALESAYLNNPALTGQRAEVRVADENVPLARAAGLPTLDGSATYQENVLKGEPTPSGFFSDPDRQIVASLNANVPLVSFGAVRNSVAAAETRVEASRLGLRSTESKIFTAVVGAYMDVLRDEAVVQLNRRNVGVMQFTVRETSDRKRAGNLGPTDVAQSQARLALAESQQQTAEARLIASREQYIRLVGHAPGKLEPPPPLPQMPASSDAVVAAALENNPELMAAKAERRAGEFDIDVADAERYPRLNAIGGINQYDYLGSLDRGTGPRNGDQGTTAFVGVRFNLPIFEGGRRTAQLRQTQARYAVANERVLDTERTIVADARTAYTNWRASSGVISSSERGVTANQTVLAGLRAEVSAGFRPLLDRLNAEQELLNAQTTLITARRDAYVAGFELLSVMGRAEAGDLNFDATILYDPTVYYESVQDRIFQLGRDPDPEPVGSGTADTSAQDAEVAPDGQPPVPAP